MLSCCPEETADPNYNFINLSSDTNLDILSHPQILTFKSSRTLSMLVLLSAPMFPICLTNVFTLELNTLLVTRLHTGPDQGYSKTQGQDVEGYAREQENFPRW